MIVAPISPGVGLPAGLASIMTPLSDMVELRGTPTSVGGGMTEASITPANPTGEVAKPPALSAVVVACRMDDPPSGDIAITRGAITAVACRLDDPPSGDIVITRGGMTAPPISVGVGELDSTVSLERPMTEEVEEPTTAT